MYCLRTSCTHPTIEWCLKDCSSSSESSFRETKEDRVHSYLISRFGAWTILVGMLQLPDDVLLAAPRWNLTMRSSGHSRMNHLCWNVLCWMSTAECSDISTRFCNTLTTRVLPGIWLIFGQRLFFLLRDVKKEEVNILEDHLLYLIAIQKQEKCSAFYLFPLVLQWIYSANVAIVRIGGEHLKHNHFAQSNWNMVMSEATF